MTTIGVSIDRTSLGIGTPLTIGPGTSGVFTVAGEIGDPAIAWRRTYAGASQWLHGSTLVSAVKEQASLPLEVLIRQTTASLLRASMDELGEAISQFTYDTTVTVDGQALVWSCDPADVAWVQSKAYRARHWASAILTIPVYPIPGV